MDSRIEKLKSTTFCGTRLTRRQIADLQKTVKMFPALSRHELAATLCTHLGWFTPKGRDRLGSCLRMLEQLESCGIVSLPAKRPGSRTGTGGRRPRHTSRSDPGSAIACGLQELMPLELEVVAEGEAVEEWKELMDRHHELGYRHPFGCFLRYWLRDRRGRQLGCLLFEAGTTRLPCRDAWIGWRDRDRAKRLKGVVSNSRFLIFPWVRVPYLASKALSMAVRRLPGDWQERHGLEPVLAETFVDPAKYRGTCYRAANWQCIGRTKGRKANASEEGRTPKDVYLYPLTKDWKQVLLTGSRRSVRRSRRPPVAVLAPEDAFVRLWSGIIETLVGVANRHDRLWQRRRRVLNTLVVVLFVFRLVFSKGRPGYATTLAELWGQCRTMGIELPQPAPVSPSSICSARARLDEQLFKTLHQEILKVVFDAEGRPRHERKVRPDTDRRWQGHRVFAVDGSSLNLPRGLVREGWRTPVDGTHYPQGLVSCLYRLQSRLPVDFDLHAHGNERAAALAHLDVLSANDVVVYDRGYYSYEMLHAHAIRGLHAVFRMQRKTGIDVDRFIHGSRRDTVIEVVPRQGTLTRLRRRNPGAAFGPHRLRLVKYAVGDTVFILGTTLLDRDPYSIDQLSDLYHARWGIEELYKVSKRLMEVEDFHGQSERGVKQELYACFTLITMTRLFANHGEDHLNGGLPNDGKPPMQTHFKHGLAAVAANIESLLLRQASALRETVARIVGEIVRCRQRLRPGRSYERRSRKPVGKWQRRRGAPATR